MGCELGVGVGGGGYELWRALVSVCVLEKGEEEGDVRGLWMILLFVNVLVGRRGSVCDITGKEANSINRKSEIGTSITYGGRGSWHRIPNR